MPLFGFEIKKVKHKNLICKYAESLKDTCSNLVLRDFTLEKDDVLLNLEIANEVTDFFYHDNQMQLCIKKSNKIIQDPKNDYSAGFDTFREVILFISCNFADNAKKILASFLKDAKTISMYDNDTIKSLVFSSSGYWHELNSIPKRNMETIYMNKNIKKDLIEDLTKFYTSKEKYLKFGVPYTRKYFLTGPPGTGKTSLIIAIGSYFNKSISSIIFDPLFTDKSLIDAFQHSFSDTIIIIEDIDTLIDNGNNSVTYSGLLNVLDGVSRKDGMVVFITTNHPEKLGEALKRPGRCDYIINFTQVQKDQVLEMYTNYFPDQSANFESFYKKIEWKYVSMSLLQKFFFENSDSLDISAQIPEINKLIAYYKNTNGDIYI